MTGGNAAAGRSGPACLDDAAGRRAASDALAAALRRLTQAVTLTEAAAADRYRLAHSVESLAQRIEEMPSRLCGDSASIDEPGVPLSRYNASKGSANPLAPGIEYVDGETDVLAFVTLRAQHQGPRGHVHGGWIATLFDDVLGHAAERVDARVLTGLLTVTYRLPVPLERCLELRTRVDAVGGRKITASGTLALAEKPDALLAEAVGTFVVPRDRTVG